MDSGKVTSAIEQVLQVSRAVVAISGLRGISDAGHVKHIFDPKTQFKMMAEKRLTDCEIHHTEIPNVSQNIMSCVRSAVGF